MSRQLGGLEDFVALTDVALRRRLEVAEGLFVAEGTPVAERALAAGYTPRRLVVIEERLDRADVATLAAAMAAAGAEVDVVPAETLRAVVGFHVHRGVLASFERRPLPTLADVLAGARTIVVLEAIVDHTNVGAIVRSCAALGADAVVLDPRCADPLYRRAIRTSMGAVFSVPYTRLDVWPAGLTDVRRSGFRVLALTPAGTEDLRSLTRPPDVSGTAEHGPVALLLGSEGAGLSSRALAAADSTVRIPMAAGVDSINVATAAALALWALAPAAPAVEPAHQAP